jgi:hypothetical protein
MYTIKPAHILPYAFITLTLACGQAGQPGDPSTESSNADVHQMHHDDRGNRGDHGDFGNRGDVGDRGGHEDFGDRGDRDRFRNYFPEFDRDAWWYDGRFACNNNDFCYRPTIGGAWQRYNTFIVGNNCGDYCEWDYSLNGCYFRRDYLDTGHLSTYNGLFGYCPTVLY